MDTSSLTVLRVDTSPRGPESLSRNLADLFVESIAYRTKNVLRRDLGADPPPAIDADRAEAELVPPAKRDERLKLALALSDVLVDELEAADLIVISTPTYNFSVPASLKAWFDQVVRMWRTFEFGSSGASGFLRGKRAVVIVTSGLRYGSGSPWEGKNLVEPLVRTLLELMGIDAIHFVHCEGQLSAPGAIEDVARAELELRLLASALTPREPFHDMARRPAH